MDDIPIWLYFSPPFAVIFGIILIKFRHRMQDNAVAVEKRMKLPKWMRLDAMSENGGAVLMIGIGFIVIGLAHGAGLLYLL